MRLCAAAVRSWCKGVCNVAVTVHLYLHCAATVGRKSLLIIYLIKWWVIKYRRGSMTSRRGRGIT